MRHREDNAVKKRVFSLLLAVCTVLSLCVPVMAAEEGIFEPEAPSPISVTVLGMLMLRRPVHS